MIIIDNDIPRKTDVKWIGCVTIYMHVVMDIRHVLMDEMKTIVVEQYVLYAVMHVYLLSIIQ